MEPDSSEDLPTLPLAAYAAYQQLYIGFVESAVAIVRQYCPEILEVSYNFDNPSTTYDDTLTSGCKQQCNHARSHLGAAVPLKTTDID